MDEKEKEKIIETIAEETQAEIRQKMSYWEKRCGMILTCYICMSSCTVFLFYRCRSWFISYKMLIFLLFMTLTHIHLMMLYQAIKNQKMYMQLNMKYLSKYSILNRLYHLKKEINKEARDERENFKKSIERINCCLASLHIRISKLGDAIINNRKRNKKNDQEKFTNEKNITSNF